MPGQRDRLSPGRRRDEQRRDRREDQRRDRRVGPEHEDARRPEERVADEAGDRRVQAGDRRQAGQLGVGHALRHEDGGEDEAGDEVGAQPAPLGTCAARRRRVRCARPRPSAGDPLPPSLHLDPTRTGSGALRAEWAHDRPPAHRPLAGRLLAPRRGRPRRSHAGLRALAGRVPGAPDRRAGPHPLLDQQGRARARRAHGSGDVVQPARTRHRRQRLRGRRHAARRPTRAHAPSRVRPRLVQPQRGRPPRGLHPFGGRRADRRGATGRPRRAVPRHRAPPAGDQLLRAHGHRHRRPGPLRVLG